jgi:ketosteroid isomerase-like protein
MPKYPRAEIEAALADYRRARNEASRTGDWSIWAAVFTEDAHYIEHAYGELHGREQICDWITKVMAPFPHMTFPQDWLVIDEENAAVVFQCQNLLAHPTDPDGESFGFPTWTRLVYGGNGKWASEEDVYNPSRDAPGVLKAWREAGGEFASAELSKMRHR